jgi:hypothetical protein
MPENYQLHEAFNRTTLQEERRGVSEAQLEDIGYSSFDDTRILTQHGAHTPTEPEFTPAERRDWRENVPTDSEKNVGRTALTAAREILEPPTEQ